MALGSVQTKVDNGASGYNSELAVLTNRKMDLLLSAGVAWLDQDKHHSPRDRKRALTAIICHHDCANAIQKLMRPQQNMTVAKTTICSEGS